MPEPVAEVVTRAKVAATGVEAAEVCRLVPAIAGARQRLDEPVRVATGDAQLDAAGVERLERLGLVRREADTLTLTARGRFLGDGVTATLLA